ncbi:WD40/YVTN/BNR-like repeat-containing protein, partial [Halocola ammonii]
MNRPLARFTPEILTVLLVSAAIFYACSDHWQTVLRKSEKKAYTAFINSHPFTLREKKTPKEWKKLPKKDRPDLAWEQNYLMTLDPATGSPAEERLIIPLAQVEDFVDDPSRYAPGDVNFPWVERGPDNVAGRTRAILWDPNNENRVFAGGVAGGLWYNDNITSSTQEWQKVNDFWDNIAVSCIEADPSNSDVWYVGTGEGWGNLDAVRGLGIWKTEDGGNSWDHLLSTANNSFRYTQKILVHPTTGHVYAATNTGLRISTNGGSSWSLVLNNGNGANNNFIADLEIGADNAIWAAVQGDGVYRTTSGNSGTWTKLNSGNGFPSFGFNRIEIATAPSDASVAYALVVSGSVVDAIYKTENTGATWTSVNEPADADPGIPDTDFTRNQGWYDLISAVDPNDPDHIYVGGIDIFHSFNGGDTWNQISHWYGGFGEPYAHADQHGMAFKPGSSNEMIFSHDGGLTYTANASATQPSIGDRNNGYNVTQYYACAINPTAGSNNYLAGAQDNGTQRYDDPGMNSTTEVTGGDGMFCHIDQTDPTYQISSYVYNNYYRSVNQGVSFSGLPGGENTGRFINPTDYDNEQDILFGAKDNSTLRRITGITSTPSVSDMTIPALNGTASHIRVSEFTSGTSTIFVGTGSGNILKINNAQAAPSTMNIDSDAELPNGYISCIELGSNEDEILVTFSNYGVNSVWYTTDGGSNWVSKEGDLPDMPVRWALFNPDNQEEVILATEVGVWSTANFSANNPNWVPSNSGLANTRVDMLQIRESDNQVIAATHGRGLFSGVFFTPSYADDAGIIAVQEPNGVVCNQTTIPSVTLKNFGSEDLTSVDIEYSLDGGTTEVYEWTGTILPGDFEEVSLPEISYSVGSHTLVVSTSQPNGVEDEDPLNDSFTSDFEFGNNPVIVQIVTDNFGAETTWEIIDSNGSIVAEGGPYTNHQANGEYPEPDVQVCLQNGCYDFSIYDTYGDGMCCAYGNGSYTLLDADGNVLITGGDGWNNSETVEFCVSSPVPGVDNDAGITEILNVSDDVCGSEITPTVRIKNLGQSNLTSANINYDVDGQQSFTYNWTGNLASNATEIVDLPIMSFTGTGPHTFTASTELPNGVEDEVPSNDSQTFDFLSEDGNGATLTLTTDCWGEEVSWTITDEGGSVIASVSQNTLADNTTFTTDLCLETGCYDFTINDSYGDGLDGTASGCGQDGDYIITDSEGNVLVEMGNPDYGFSITQSFCIGETDVPGCTNILACNYNASATIDDGSCILIGDSCDDGDPTTVNDSVNGSCECEGDVFPGCTNELACNYNPIATLDDGSCLFTGDTCDDGDPDTVN